MDDGELERKFDEIAKLIKALHGNIELLNKVGVSFYALVDLLLQKGIIKSEELLPLIEKKISQYESAKGKRSQDLKGTDSPASPTEQ